MLSLSLEKTIKEARKKCNLDQTYILLAIIETKAYKTLYFRGMEGTDLINELIYYILSRGRTFLEGYQAKEWKLNKFHDYMAESPRLCIDSKKFKRIINVLKKKGEGGYEFKNFKKLV